MKRHLTPFVILAACAATAVWAICSAIPEIRPVRTFAATGAAVIVLSAFLVRARGIPAWVKWLAVAVMALCGFGLYQGISVAVTAFLLTLGKWRAFAIHLGGGMLQAALVLVLHKAGFVIAWRRKAETKLAHPFWKWVLRLGTLPTAVMASLIASPILAAFVVLFSGVRQRLMWLYVTIAVSVTTATFILGGDQLGLGAFISRLFS